LILLLANPALLMHADTIRIFISAFISRAEGNARDLARKAAAGALLHQGTQSLGRAAGRRYIRQGDASSSPPDEVNIIDKKSRDTCVQFEILNNLIS
jgi:hypothetical protein